MGVLRVTKKGCVNAFSTLTKSLSRRQVALPVGIIGGFHDVDETMLGLVFPQIMVPLECSIQAAYFERPCHWKAANRNATRQYHSLVAQVDQCCGLAPVRFYREDTGCSSHFHLLNRM